MNVDHKDKVKRWKIAIQHCIGIFLFFCRVDKVQIFDPMPYEDVRTGLTFTP